MWFSNEMAYFLGAMFYIGLVVTAIALAAIVWCIVHFALWPAAAWLIEAPLGVL